MVNKSSCLAIKLAISNNRFIFRFCTSLRLRAIAIGVLQAAVFELETLMQLQRAEEKPHVLNC